MSPDLQNRGYEGLVFMFTFDSRIFKGYYDIAEFSQDEIKNEPMLFSCDYEHARKLGGPITNHILNQLSLDEVWDTREPLIVDTRVHMLMEGWFPCIPGYHHDDVPRERFDAQPNYYNPSYRAEHVMVLLNGDICPTEFAIGKSEFEDVRLGEIYYKKWHNDVVDKISKGLLEKQNAESNKLLYFDWQTWHQGVRAVKNGWRYFFRASRHTNRKYFNELRRQVQVYLEFPMEGW